MSDLSPEARALLASAAKGDDPTPADRDRVARALAGSLGISALMPAAAQAAGGSLGATLGLSAVKAVAAGAVVLGVAGSAWVGLRPERPNPLPATTRAVVGHGRAPRPTSAAPGYSRPGASALTAPRETRLTTVEAAPAERRIEPLRPPARSVGRVGGSASEDRLRAESGLIAAAHRSLLRGDAADALARIAEYDARFPHGTLREERDLERLLALCAAGRRDESRAAGRRFLSSYPDSPSTARAASACADTIPSRDAAAPGTPPVTAAPAAPEATE